MYTCPLQSWPLCLLFTLWKTSVKGSFVSALRLWAVRMCELKWSFHRFPLLFVTELQVTFGGVTIDLYWGIVAFGGLAWFRKLYSVKFYRYFRGRSFCFSFFFRTLWYTLLLSSINFIAVGKKNHEQLAFLPFGSKKKKQLPLLEYRKYRA